MTKLREKLFSRKNLERVICPPLSLLEPRCSAKPRKQAEAERELQKVQSGAVGKGLLLLEWQARLALADVKTLSGHLSSARSNLDLVNRQAIPRGFHLVARKAADAEASLGTRLRNIIFVLAYWITTVGCIPSGKGGVCWIITKNVSPCPCCAVPAG